MKSDYWLRSLIIYNKQVVLSKGRSRYLPDMARLVYQCRPRLVSSRHLGSRPLQKQVEGRLETGSRHV